MTWEGFALVLGGAFLLALFQVINKKLLVKQAPADCISVINFLGSGVLLLAISLLFDPPHIENWFGFPQGLFWPLIATSVLNIVILFGNVRALTYGDVSLIAPIAATQPMVVLIPAWLILGEVPGVWGYAGLFLLALGMYVFSFVEEVYVIDPATGEKRAWLPPRYLTWMGGFSRYYAPIYMLFQNKGVQIALLVAMCGAVSINFDKLSALRSSFTFAPAFILIFCGLIGLIKTYRTKEWEKVDKSHLFHLMINPIVFTVVIICFWVAFNYGFAAYVGALKRTMVIFALLLGWFLLKEQQAIRRWPGVVIMTTGAVFLSL